MTTISAIIITFNEAVDIRGCLESIKWVDEIIVIDSGSTDATVDICRDYTDKVVVTDWPGYGQQKNRALALATSDWVLALDADERLTPELSEEIQRTLRAPTFEAYQLHRVSYFCNERIRFGDWGWDWCTRLFRRGCATFKEVLVHENLLVNGRIGKLTHSFDHYTYHNLDEALQKSNHYSTLSAQMQYETGKRANLSTAIFHGLYTFFRGYCLKLGFLDGASGYIVAAYNAGMTYYRHLKIREFSNNTAK